MNRIPELDVFRGIAALGVVVFHYTAFWDQRFSDIHITGFEFAMGLPWVQFFFIISGFVISMSIIQRDSPSRFLKSRFMRLFPAYWAAVLITALVEFIWPIESRGQSLVDVLMNFSMVQQWFGFTSVNGAFWSLHLEVLFYILIALISMLGQTKNLFTGFLALIGIQICTLALDGSVFQLPAEGSRYLLFKDIHLFFAGFVFYQMYKNPSLKLHGFIALCFSIEVYICIAYKNNLFSFWPVATFFTAFYLFLSNKLKFICVKPLLYLGSISYPLYLIHQDIGYILLHGLYKVSDHTLLNVSVTIAAAIALAHIISRAIENRFYSK